MEGSTASCTLEEYLGRIERAARETVRHTLGPHRARLLPSAAMTNQASRTAIVLAAGQGTRMKSGRPKVMHELCGRPMIDYVVDAAYALSLDDRGAEKLVERWVRRGVSG